MDNKGSKKITAIKSKKNSSSKKNKVLATFSPNELLTLLTAEGIVNRFKDEYDLALMGYKSLWKTLQNKYDFPNNVSFDKEKGTISALSE